MAQSHRNLSFTADDFERVRRHLHARTGIALGDGKSEMVYSRLARRLRAAGKDSFKAYLDELEANARHPEWEGFVNALTTNLTSFFREAYHFPLLAEHLRSRRTPPRIWSCGVSTGEEACSIAMTLAEMNIGALGSPCIFATDIDTQALAAARAGIYTLDSVERLPADRRKQFFLKGSGTHAGKARVRPELLRMIKFKAFNLLAPQWDVGAPFDAIFCRNVLVYFDIASQRRVLARFAQCLKPGGLLFVGHSENFRNRAPGYRLRGQTVYELLSPACTAKPAHTAAASGQPS